MREDLGIFGFSLSEKELEAHELFLETRGDDHRNTRDSVQAPVDFYEAWAEAAPGEGHGEKAAEWKAVIV